MIPLPDPTDTSSPLHQVVTRFDEPVPMRDGVDLATDLFLPDDPEPRPVLLARTPYNKRNQLERHGEWFARRGYAVAIQDCRGRFKSEGTFYIYKHEPEDGYDTVQWLANQPFCNGKIGTLGTSYGAWVQNGLASLDPPNLEAMFVNQGAANARKATFRHNGAFELRWLCWALTVGGGFAQACLDDSALQAQFANLDVRDLLQRYPIRPGQSPLRHLPEYETWLYDVLGSGSASDPLWQLPGFNFERHYDQHADVPTVYSGGWYDSYTKATCDNYLGLSERKNSEQFLFMGPWTHGWDRYPLPSWNKSYSGEVEFGSSAIEPFNEVRLRFFDHYLKGRNTWSEPTVRYFLMGTGDGHRTAEGRLFHGGEWNQADRWPPSGTEPTDFYLHGDGTLSPVEPDQSEGSTRFTYDPRNPVPTLGGNCSSYATYEPREESLLEYPLAERKLLSITGAGGFDQRTRPDTFGAEPPYGPLEWRDDVLVFRTPPLEEPVTVVGPIRVWLYGSTDGSDTDFTAKLIDEYPPSTDFPDGFALNLSDSICRGRFRGYREEADPLTPGDVYEFYLEPYPTANHFKRGHRIRLDVSSSNFPRFDPNMNTGGPLTGEGGHRVARNTLHHSGEYPSRIELPVRT